MKNLNNLVYLVKSANQTLSANPVKDDDRIFKQEIPKPINYSEAFNHTGDYTQGELLEYASSPNYTTHMVDLKPVTDVNNDGQIIFKEQPNVTLDRGLMDTYLNPNDPAQPITLAKDPNASFEEYVMPQTPDIPDIPDKLAWYDKLTNWIKENPWTAGAGALGLGGLGYYLLSDDDEEEEEEE